MKKKIFVILIVFSFLAILISGCAPTGKYHRTYISPNDPVYDIPTIPAAPQHVVEAVLAADKEKTNKQKLNKKQPAGKKQQISARPSKQGYAEFLERVKKADAEQKAQAVRTKNPNKTRGNKKSAITATPLILKKLSKIEGRLNYVEKYSRKNRNRIGLLEERFNLSVSGKIQAEIILFKPGSSELSADGEKFLKNLAVEYTGGKVENIVIKGHASVTKGKIDNKILAKKRAESAYSYLKARCVPAKIIPVGETDEYGINTNAMITWLGKR